MEVPERQKQFIETNDKWKIVMFYHHLLPIYFIIHYFYLIYIIVKGTARTQFPTTRNYTPKLIAFGLIASASPVNLQWQSLTLEKPPVWSWLALSQVSLLSFYFFTSSWLIWQVILKLDLPEWKWHATPSTIPSSIMKHHRILTHRYKMYQVHSRKMVNWIWRMEWKRMENCLKILWRLFEMSKHHQGLYGNIKEKRREKSNIACNILLYRNYLTTFSTSKL